VNECRHPIACAIVVTMRWLIVLFVTACGGHPAPAPVPSNTSSQPSEPDRGAASERRTGPPKDCVWIDVFEILERVYFDPGSSRLRDPSRPIVDAIADTIKANPRIDKLGVVGARAAGEPDTLALDRAAALVAALVARGVRAQQLEAHGHLGAIDGDPKLVWFVMLRVDNHDRRPPTGEARWIPWQRDCAGSWRAHREHGARLDCDCANAPPN
jgi:OmpA family